MVATTYLFRANECYVSTVLKTGERVELSLAACLASQVTLDAPEID